MGLCKVLSERDLELLSQRAAQSERLRLNQNLHPELSDPVQRLCNAFEPGTYVRPHWHSEDDRWELFLVLRGRCAVLTFDENGKVIERLELREHGGDRIVEIPPRTIHTVVSLAHGSVLFEVKPGPYRVATDKDFAKWAPKEGEPSVPAWVRWYEQAQPGEVFTAESGGAA